MVLFDDYHYLLCSAVELKNCLILLKFTKHAVDIICLTKSNVLSDFIESDISIVYFMCNDFNRVDLEKFCRSFLLTEDSMDFDIQY